jgi:hypothetical protein
LIFIGIKIGLFSSIKKIKPVPTFPIIIDSISQEEYKKWNTYTNSEMKYSFKYPQDWVVKEISANETSLYSKSRATLRDESPNPVRTNITIKIYASTAELPSNPNGINLSEWVDAGKENNKVNKIVIDGINAYETIYSYPTRIIYVQKGNLIYSIFDDSTGKNIVQQQIVNSLTLE